MAVPAPLDPPPATLAEVAEEVGAVVQRTRGGWAAVHVVDVPTFERALDGLVRHAHRDLGGLLAAPEPVEHAPWDGPGGDGSPAGALLVAVAAECAGRCGARGENPEVTQVAAWKGRTGLVREAWALRGTLAAG